MKHYNTLLLIIITFILTACNENNLRNTSNKKEYIQQLSDLSDQSRKQQLEKDIDFLTTLLDSEVKDIQIYFSFSIGSGNKGLEEDTIRMRYIRYSTTMMSQSRPLASYAGIKFESLSIITDEADEKALMAIGSTSYAKPKDVEKIIARLLSINETLEIQRKSWSNSGTNLIVREGDKVIKLFIDIKLDTEATSGQELFTPEQYSALRYEMADEEEIKCILFVTNTAFDQALNVASSFSGDMTHYN